MNKINSNDYNNFGFDKEVCAAVRINVGMIKLNILRSFYLKQQERSAISRSRSSSDIKKIENDVMPEGTAKR